MEYRLSAVLTALLKVYHYLSKPLLIKKDLPAQRSCLEMYYTGTLKPSLIKYLHLVVIFICNLNQGERMKKKKTGSPQTSTVSQSAK